MTELYFFLRQLSLQELGGHTSNYNKTTQKNWHHHDGPKDTIPEFIKQDSSVIENPHVMDFQTSDLL